MGSEDEDFDNENGWALFTRTNGEISSQVFESKQEALAGEVEWHIEAYKRKLELNIRPKYVDFHEKNIVFEKSSSGEITHSIFENEQLAQKYIDGKAQEARDNLKGSLTFEANASHLVSLEGWGQWILFEADADGNVSYQESDIYPSLENAVANVSSEVAIAFLEQNLALPEKEMQIFELKDNKYALCIGGEQIKYEIFPRQQGAIDRKKALEADLDESESRVLSVVDQQIVEVFTTIANQAGCNQSMIIPLGESWFVFIYEEENDMQCVGSYVSQEAAEAAYAELTVHQTYRGLFKTLEQEVLFGFAQNLILSEPGDGRYRASYWIQYERFKHIVFTVNIRELDIQTDVHPKEKYSDLKNTHTNMNEKLPFPTLAQCTAFGEFDLRRATEWSNNLLIPCKIRWKSQFSKALVEFVREFVGSINNDVQSVSEVHADTQIMVIYDATDKTVRLEHRGTQSPSDLNSSDSDSNRSGIFES